MKLHEIAPRLAQARGLLVEILRRERDERFRQRARELKAERLVAHRELQLVRAQMTGDRRYIARREDKLKRALRERARIERRAA